MTEDKRKQENPERTHDNKFDDFFKAPKQVPNLKSPTLFDEPYIEPLGSINDIFRHYTQGKKT